MSSNFRHYRSAAEAVKRGWLKHGYTDGFRICMVQGVGQSLGSTYADELPQEVVSEIDAQLETHLDYRIIRYFTRKAGMKSQAAIENWNDAPWRRKRSVIKALSSLADTHEVQWLRDERSRLMIEVANLRTQVAVLQERVRQLEQDKQHLLKRLVNYRTLKSDKQQLKELSAQLDTKFAELEQLPA